MGNLSSSAPHYFMLSSLWVRVRVIYIGKKKRGTPSQLFVLTFTFHFFPPCILPSHVVLHYTTLQNVYITPFSGIVPVPAALFGLLWLWRDLGGAMDGAASSVAHAAHIGGAATGLAFFLALRRGRLLRRW
jgi:membrane associated rhomboid family serine protease